MDFAVFNARREEIASAIEGQASNVLWHGRGQRGQFASCARVHQADAVALRVERKQGPVA